MRAHAKHLRTLSVLLALAAFTFMFLRLDSRPPYQWVTLYGNLSVLCIIGATLSLIASYLWPLPLITAAPREALPPSPLRTIAHLFGFATYVTVALGILLIALSTIAHDLRYMHLGYIGIHCLLIGIILGMAAKLAELQAARNTRTRK